jgi:hypothetical protein
MRTAAVLAVSLGLGLGLVAPTANAVPKKAAGAKKQSPPACGAKVLPLVEGNTWKYVQVQAPSPILPELLKLAPPQAKTVVITVKKLETKGPESVATLEEKLSYEVKNPSNEKKPLTYEVVVNSTIRCNKTTFEISPESFFFAGEPGGFRELTFDKLERSKDTSLKLTNGTIGDTPWREDIVAQFTRTPGKGTKVKLSAGKLELERSFTPERSEAVMTISGNHWPKTEKLALVTTGRITLATPVSPNPTKLELPANWVTKLWFENNIGVVQTLNMYAHMFQLAEFTLN